MRLIDADRLKSYIDCGHLRPPTEVCFSELDVCNMIDKAPTVSADAVQGWRNGKPTEQGEYIVTLDSYGYKHIDLFYYGRPMMPNRKVRGNCWYRSDDEWGDVVYDDKDIIAWMPLPKPYREESEVEK